MKAITHSQRFFDKKGKFVTRAIYLFLLSISLFISRSEAQTFTYSESFSGGTAYNSSSAQFINWSTFIGQLSPRTYLSVTIKGSNDATGVSVTDPVVATAIASALYTNAPNSWTSGGRDWAVGNCGSGLEISASGSICNCTNPGYIVRPQIANTNWGGINGATCDAGSQTLTVVFVAGNNPAPAIGSFTPTTVGNGSTVTLTGTNFTGATAVSFGGTAASSFIVNSATQITAVVGSGSTGSVSVTTPGGTASLAGFTWIPANPTSITATYTILCNGASTTLSANGAAGTVYWYTSSCGGTATSPATGNTLTVSPSATTTYYARNYSNSQFSAGCASISIIVNARPTVADLQASGTGIKWYLTSSGGSALATSTPLQNNTHYYASQTVNGVESTVRFDVLVTMINP
jgi:hypothetical protein